MNRLARSTIRVLAISIVAIFCLAPKAQAAVPIAPNAVTAISQSDKPLNSGLGKIIFWWTDQSTNENQFIVEYQEGSGLWTAATGSPVTSTTTAGTGTQYTVTQDNLNDNTHYTFHVSAKDTVSGDYSVDVPHSNYTFDRTKPATPSLGVAESNCMGYWSFDDTSNVGKDYSAYGNNGTITSAPTSVSGVSSNALGFDGVDDYVAATPLVSGLTRGTLECWVKFNNLSPSNQTPVGIGNAGAGKWRIDVYSNGGVAADFWLDGNAASAAGVISAGLWYHLASTFDGTTKRMYVNGVQVASAVSAATAVNASTVQISGYTPGGYIVNGLIDEVRIYNRALTATEIQAQYSSGNHVDLSAKPGDSNLIGYWNFDEGSGSYTYDASGNGKTGTWNGTGSHWTTGKYGIAGNFNGTDDYVEYADSASLNPGSSAFSISAWFKLASAGALNGSIIYNKENLYECSAGGGYFTYAWQPHWAWDGGTSFPVNVGEWTHAVVVYDKGNQYMYKNGVLVYSRAQIGDMGTNTNALRIGARGAPAAANSFFPGLIDEVRIYNSALTARQIHDLYSSGAPKYLHYQSPTETGSYESLLELVANGGAETGDTTNWSGITGVTSSDSYEGTYSFYRTGSTTILSSEYIPIDTNEEYSLQGFFKSYGSGGNSKLYFGYKPYDENKTFITHQSIDRVSGTDTTLYAACSTGDAIVKVVDGTNWYVLSHGRMAFDIDDSGSYTDLPNFNLSNADIIRVENMGTYWEIQFGTTVGKAYPVGTKVGMHKSGGSYMYEAASNATIPTSWTKYDAVTTSESLVGDSTGKWRHGTKYAQIMMLPNYAQDATYELRFDDISVLKTSDLIRGYGYTADTFDGVSDDFSTDSSGFFTEYGEDWSISGGYLQDTIDNLYAHIVHNKTMPNDVIVEADVNNGDDDWIGLIFRYTDNSNFYTFTVRGETNLAELRKNGQTLTAVGSKSMTINTGQWYHLKARAVGSSIKCYVDGELVITATDSTHTSGRAGLYSGANSTVTNYWDNFSVVQVGTDCGDTQAPATPGSGSVSHTASTWSTDNTINFAWTEPVSSPTPDDYFYYLKAVDAEGNEDYGITDGLIAYWTLNGNTNDTSSSNLGFGTNNGVTWTDGKIGQGGNFASSTGINMGSLGSPLLTAETTISFWIKSTDVTTPARQNPFDQAYGGWGTMTLETNGSISWFFGSNGGNTTPYGSHPSSVGTITNGSWIHIAAVRNPSGYTYKWYKNGEYLNGSTYDSTYPVINTTTFTLGDGYVNPINGLIDDFRIYNRALSADECRALYHNTKEIKLKTVETPISGYHWAANDTTPEVGGTWVARTTNSTATAAVPDGTGNYIYVKAEDGAGNLSVVKTYGPFYIDVIAPTTAAPTISSGTLGSNGWYTTDVGLYINSSDATSGIITEKHKTSGGVYNAGSATDTWTDITEGIETWVGYAIDNAGNARDGLDTLQVKIDKTNPSATIAIAGGAAYTTSASVTLNLTYSDATSGINQVRYSNDGVWDTEIWEAAGATKAWTLTAGDGTKTVYYQVSDNSGRTTSVSDTIVLDTTAPTAGAFSYGTITTTSIAVSITGATDATSGVPASCYYIEYDANATVFSVADGNSGWGNGSYNPATLSANIAHAFRWKVKDNAGNETGWNTPTPAYKYTLCAAADALCNRSTSTWYQGNSSYKFDFTSSNLVSGSIQYYRYIWDRSPSTAVGSGDTQWLSGTLSLTPANSKGIYLHVLPYNGDNVAGTQVNYGPYYFVDTSRLLKHGKFFDDDGNLIEMGPK